MAHGGDQSENTEPASSSTQTSGSDAGSAEEADLPRISQTDTASGLSARKARSEHSSPGYPISNTRLSSGSSIASSEDVLEHVLHPDVIVGTPEAENYFRDQSHRLRKHILRGDMVIDVDDLDAISPESGLYVLSDPTQLSQAADFTRQRSPISSSFERLYDNVRLEDVRGETYLESKDFEGKLGDKFSTRTFPRGSSYEDLYTGLAQAGEISQVEEGFSGLLAQDLLLSGDAFPKGSSPSVKDPPCVDQSSYFVEVDKDETLTSDMVGDDDDDVDAAPRIVLLPGDFPVPESSCVQREPVVSSPDQSRRSAVRRHVTFHHSPRLTVTDNDDVRDVSEQHCNVLVVEPGDDDVEGSVVVEVDISDESIVAPSGHVIRQYLHLGQCPSFLHPFETSCSGCKNALHRQDATSRESQERTASSETCDTTSDLTTSNKDSLTFQTWKSEKGSPVEGRRRVGVDIEEPYVFSSGLLPLNSAVVWQADSMVMEESLLGCCCNKAGVASLPGLLCERSDPKVDSSAASPAADVVTADGSSSLLCSLEEAETSVPRAGLGSSSSSSAGTSSAAVPSLSGGDQRDYSASSSQATHATGHSESEGALTSSLLSSLSGLMTSTEIPELEEDPHVTAGETVAYSTLKLPEERQDFLTVRRSRIGRSFSHGKADSRGKQSGITRVLSEPCSPSTPGPHSLPYHNVPLPSDDHPGSDSKEDVIAANTKPRTEDSGSPPQSSPVLPD